MKGRHKQTISGSYKRDFYDKGRKESIMNRYDFRLILDDDEMEELEKTDHRQAVMLQRGTGKLRMCSICGDVYVNSEKNERMWGVWLNRNGFKCFFCRNGKIRPDDDKTKIKRKIMKKVWDLWLKRINVGVKINNLIIKHIDEL